MVDMISVEIIYRRTVNLTNINTLANLQSMVDERKIMTMCWQEAQEALGGYVTTVSIEREDLGV